MKQPMLIGILLAGLIGLDNAQAAPPPGHWTLTPEVSDEFDGTQPDQTKWQTFNPYYSGPEPGFYAAENALLSNGQLQMMTRFAQSSSPDFPWFTTAHMKSTARVKYGYFETRAKVAATKAVSAFWLYRYTERGTFEIDIVEAGGASPGREKIHHSNAHVYYGDPQFESDHNRISDPRQWQAPAALAEGFHTYGLEWNEREINWYFDGALIRSKANLHWHQPMHVVFTTEVRPGWMGMPSAQELPAAFTLDYVRIWQQR